MQPKQPSLIQTPEQLAENAKRLAEQAPTQSGWNPISDIGTFFNLPSIADTNSGQARTDALTGATDRFGGLLRGEGSSAYSDIVNKEYFRSNGNIYNAAGDVIGTYNQNSPTETGSGEVSDNNIFKNTNNVTNQTYGVSASDEQAQYQEQIDNLNKLLGYVGTQKEAGLGRIGSEFGAAKEKQAKSIAEQRLQNTQAQEKGLNEVGNFANTSMNNLNRLLQGANAGRSSVGQILTPYLVGKGADMRRTGVINTAGENARALDTTEDEANLSLENQRKKSEEDFLTQILNKQNELTSNRQGLERSKVLATGAGFNAAKAASQASTNELEARQNELSNLFSQYKPSYATKEVAPLASYQVDPATLTTGQNTPTQSSFYLSQLKKKQQLGL